MSSLRVQKIFSAAPNQIKLLGGYSFDWQTALAWAGRVTAGADAGKDACVIDGSSSTWATGNLRVVLVAVPAMDQVPGSVSASKTQSHASGHFIDGGVRLKVYAETPATWTGTHAHFLRDVQQHLVGQNSAPIELYLCANGTNPEVEGVNGAGSSASYTSAGIYLPYGMGYAGGI